MNTADSSKRGGKATTLVSMIRGINVAGHKPIKMAELVKLYQDLGFENPRSYLQSGNVVFETRGARGRDLAGAIERGILRAFEMDVSVALKSAAQMSAAFAGNPLASRPGVDPKFLYATFLIRPDPGASLDAVTLPLGKGEVAVHLGDVVYLYCPNGFGDTRINNTFFERKLRVRATTRNWNTVTALERMARGAPLA
jgi:uncharacterized protein (DUF1697 family)